MQLSAAEAGKNHAQQSASHYAWTGTTDVVHGTSFMGGSSAIAPAVMQLELNNVDTQSLGCSLQIQNYLGSLHPANGQPARLLSASPNNVNRLQRLDPCLMVVGSHEQLQRRDYNYLQPLSQGATDWWCRPKNGSVTVLEALPHARGSELKNQIENQIMAAQGSAAFQQLDYSFSDHELLVDAFQAADHEQQQQQQQQLTASWEAYGKKKKRRYDAEHDVDQLPESKQRVLLKRSASSLRAHGPRHTHIIKGQWSPREDRYGYHLLLLLVPVPLLRDCECSFSQYSTIAVVLALRLNCSSKLPSLKDEMSSRKS